MVMAKVTMVVEQVAFDREQAARYLGYKNGRALEGRRDIPWVDLSEPGSKRPVVRYLKADLDRVLTERRHDARGVRRDNENNPLNQRRQQ